MKKVIQRSARLIWSTEKQNVKQTVVKIGQSQLTMQAVPQASSIFLSLLKPYQQVVQEASFTSS